MAAVLVRGIFSLFFSSNRGIRSEAVDNVELEGVTKAPKLGP